MERSRILVSAAACFLAAAAGCVPSAGGEGSESHFVCRSQADCDPLGPAYICEDRVCTKAGGAPEAGVADAPVPQRLQAGVCFGERTRCDPVSFEELAGGPTVEACDPTPSDPVVVDGGVSMETSVTWLNPNWLVDLETVSCPAPGCLQQVQELLPGANGELWISANVWTPHAEDLLGTEVVGDSLSRLGSDGQSLGAPAVTFRSRLSDASFSVRGMELGSDGDLFRAGASPSFDSIELQQYDEAGNRVAAFTTADSISSAMVAWGPDGSAAVLYRYPLEAGPSGINVARFDATGTLLWNQTAIGFISEEQDVQVSFDGGPHVGVDASGDTTVVLFVMQQPLENSTQRIVKLDPDGNVRWAKRVSDAGGLVSWGGARTLTFADGSAIVTHSSMLPPDGTYRWIIDEIDSDGAPIRRHLQNANKGWDLGPVMDRARLFQTMGHPDNYFAFQAIDLDANTCDVFVIPVRQCPEETGFHGCPPVSIAVSEGTLYFSVGTRVGAVTLP